jgi:hypothetical protein
MMNKSIDQTLRDEHKLRKSLNCDILNDLGSALLGQERYEEAIEALKGSITIKASQVLATNSKTRIIGTAAPTGHDINGLSFRLS